MNISMQLAVFAAVCLCLGEGAPDVRVARAKQQRPTRGFKNVEMMTARGFGKRDRVPTRSERLEFKMPGSAQFAYGFKRAGSSDEGPVTVKKFQLPGSAGIARNYGKRSKDNDGAVQPKQFYLSGLYRGASGFGLKRTPSNNDDEAKLTLHLPGSARFGRFLRKRTDSYSNDEESFGSIEQKRDLENRYWPEGSARVAGGIGAKRSGNDEKVKPTFRLTGPVGFGRFLRKRTDGNSNDEESVGSIEQERVLEKKYWPDGSARVGRFAGKRRSINDENEESVGSIEQERVLEKKYWPGGSARVGRFAGKRRSIIDENEESYEHGSFEQGEKRSKQYVFDGIARANGKSSASNDDEEVYGLDNFWEMLEASPEREGQDGNDEKTLESIPMDWFVNEMLNNPDFTRSVVRKFIDLNQDGQLTSDELLRNVV